MNPSLRPVLKALSLNFSRDQAASHSPPASVQAASVVMVQPSPLQAFWPLQEVDAVAHSLVPLQELPPTHLPCASPAASWAPADAVSGAVRLPNGVTMERDPSLRPGEARISGRWASAELTREAALSVAREVLS